MNIPTCTLKLYDGVLIKIFANFTLFLLKENLVLRFKSGNYFLCVSYSVITYLEPDAQNLRLVEMSVLQPFVAIFLPTTWLSFTKLKFILRCWTGLRFDWSKSHDTNAKKDTQMRSFLQNWKKRKKRNGNTYVLCQNLLTN